MLNFEEELAKYKPIEQASDVERLVSEDPMTDMTDIMREMLDKAAQEKEI